MLSHLVKISSNQQHQPECTLTMAQISVDAVTVDTVNKSAQRYVLLVEILMNNIRLILLIIFIYLLLR